MNIFSILITQPLANGLILFYHALGNNLGLATIAFSLALRVGLSPLTRPYMESMKKLKSYQKDLDKLKARHKDDKVKLAQAQSDFYKEKGINPTAGCLPYLLQIVILIAMFNLFRTVLAANGEAVTKFNELLYAPLKIAADQHLNTQFLYWDLTQPDKLMLAGLPFALPGFLIIAAAILQFISAKMAAPYIEEEEVLASETPEKADDFAASMQSSMIYTFPLMTLFIGLQFASGLALYWLVFSGFQTIQQYRTSGWGGLTPWVKKIKKTI